MPPAATQLAFIAVTTDPRLADLRRRIDDLDRRLVEILAERIAVCEEVARVKEASDTPVIQPDRVRQVIGERRQWAIDSGADPDFVEQVLRTVLAETHRIEVAGRRPDAAPDKTATPEGIRSAIDTVASRIDHVVVAVPDLAAAIERFTQHLGFHRVDAVDQRPGVAAVEAGGVAVVLVSPEAGRAVARHIAQHGPGLHHVAVDVLNAGYARAALAGLDPAPEMTPLVVDAAGHEQFFTLRDPATGVQFGFISRTGHRVGLATDNALLAFGEPPVA